MSHLMQWWNRMLFEKYHTYSNQEAERINKT